MRKKRFDNEIESCFTATEKFKKCIHICIDLMHVIRETLNCYSQQFLCVDVGEFVSA